MSFTNEELAVLAGLAAEMNAIRFECNSSSVCSQDAVSITTRPCCGLQLFSCPNHDELTKLFYDNLSARGNRQACLGCGQISGRPIVAKL